MDILTSTRDFTEGLWRNRKLGLSRRAVEVLPATRRELPAQMDLDGGAGLDET